MSAPTVPTAIDPAITAAADAAAKRAIEEQARQNAFGKTSNKTKGIAGAALVCLLLAFGLIALGGVAAGLAFAICGGISAALGGVAYGNHQRERANDIMAIGEGQLAASITKDMQIAGLQQQIAVLQQQAEPQPRDYSPVSAFPTPPQYTQYATESDAFANPSYPGNPTNFAHRQQPQQLYPTSYQDPSTQAPYDLPAGRNTSSQQPLPVPTLANQSQSTSGQPRQLQQGTRRL